MSATMAESMPAGSLADRKTGVSPHTGSAWLLALPYAIGAMCVAFGVMSGDVSRSSGLLLGLALVATPLLIALAMGLAWRRGAADPALRVLQSVIAVTWTVLLYATTGRLHAAQLTVLVFVMALAVCFLPQRAAARICAYAFAAMSIAMFAMSRWQPAVYMPKVELFLWLMMAGDLPAVLLLGKQLFRLRSRMRAKRAELEAGVERLRELATRDALTGLPNRHFMFETFDHLARSSPAGEACAVVLIDLDHFKQVNDTWGHAAGDLTLRAFASLAAAQLRQVDVLSRWGGEEFLIVCPKTDAEGARISTARLRQALETLQVLGEAPDFRIRFSAGITEVAPSESLEAALARSDAALYAAKAAGRSRSEVALSAG